MLVVLRSVRPLTLSCAFSDISANLKLALSLLEDITSQLVTHLEKKRLCFPRLFFLSDDQLLDVLSYTKVPERVQPHLRSLFDGIARVDIGVDLSITTMISVEGERVVLSKPVSTTQCDGMVELWLLQLEQTMRTTLSTCVKNSLDDLFTSNRLDWMQVWPSQVVLAVNDIIWTREVESTLRRSRGK